MWHQATKDADGVDVKFRWGAAHTWGKAAAVFAACEVDEEKASSTMVTNTSMDIKVRRCLF